MGLECGSGRFATGWAGMEGKRGRGNLGSGAEGQLVPLPQDKRWVIGCHGLCCLFSASQLPLCVSSVCVLALNSLLHPSFLPVAASLLPHSPICASLLSVPSLCHSCLPLPSLCSLSAGFSLSAFAVCPLCLFALCTSLFALQVSPHLLQSLFASSCPRPCLILISSLINDLLEAGSSVGVLYLRELAVAPT